MVTNAERQIIMNLVQAGKVKAEIGLFRVVVVSGLNPGTQATLERIRRRQKVDDWHHAPCCPANHWCRKRLVFSGCNCGAEKARLK
jgi:hypothetical protein